MWDHDLCNLDSSIQFIIHFVNIYAGKRLFHLGILSQGTLSVPESLQRKPILYKKIVTNLKSSLISYLFNVQESVSEVGVSGSSCHLMQKIEVIVPECRNRILVVTESARMNEAEPGYGN